MTTSSPVAQPGGLEVSARALVGTIGAAIVVGIVARFLADDSEIGWFLLVVCPAIAIAIAPGALMLLAWHSRPAWSLFDLIALGLGLSLGVVQLLTIGALAFHWSPGVSLAALGIVAVAHGVVAWRTGRAVTVRVSRGDLVLGLLILGVTIGLYAAGSPFDNTEDEIHVAIIERLMHLPDPSIHTIYFVRDVVYTYPFPGIHYLLALIARVGDVDALFLYSKMRAFWGPAALAITYGLAAAVFESPLIGFATAVACATLVANGTLGAVPGMSWGQLAPFSHASDVAMGVLLPALLLLAFAFLRASSRRERVCFLAATLMLALMLTIVHPREMVQLEVYLVMGAAAALVFGRASWPLAQRLTVLILATMAILVAYRIWHEQAVQTVTTLVDAKRRDLEGIFQAATWGQLFQPPLPLLRNYMPAAELTFFGWYPAVILTSSLPLLVLARRQLTWLVAGSIASYLLIIRIPALAIPYIYASYYEILYTPIRNLSVFVPLLIGASLYIIAVGLSRGGYLALIGGALAAGTAVGAAVRMAGPYLAVRQDWLFVPAIGGLALMAGWTYLTRNRPRNDTWINRPSRRWLPALAVLLLPILLLTRVPDSALSLARWAHAPRTPAALLEPLRCSPSNTFCPPPAALVRLAREISPHGIFAVDRQERYPSSLFFPQQMTVWTGDLETFEPIEDQLFGAYVRHYRASMARHGDQPLFNDRETREERLAFVRDLGVTHVLVNPRTHAIMTRVLGKDGDTVRKQYDDGAWALYEVRRPGPEGSGQP